MSSNNYKSSQSGRSGGNNRILYDARGTRVKRSPFSNKYLKFLLFYIIPYFVINGIILMLVCATPHITVNVKDTDNYITTEVDFTIKSLLPIKSLNVTLESEDVEYKKSGSTYKAVLNKNGTFCVEAKSMNGMSKTVYSDISMLDDTAPSVDESSINISRGVLSYTLYDTQSGVNYDSVYAIINDTDTIYPSEVDKNLGLVTMALPKLTKSVELHFEDMVGNARSGKIAVTFDNGEETAETEVSEESESQAAG